MLQCVIVGKPLSFVISLMFIRYRPLSSNSEIKISKRKQVSARLTQPHQIHRNRHLFSMKLIDCPACSCGFINENEFHFFLVCPLYNRPRVTLQNAMGNIAPFTLGTLLYGSENLDLTVNKRIVTETLRFIKD